MWTVIKKYFYGLLAQILAVGVSFAQSSEDRFFYGDRFTDNPSADINGVIKDDIVNAGNGPLKGILNAFRIDQFINKSEYAAVSFISHIINIALGVVSFIALIVIIYGFAQMFFVSDEEGLNRAKKIISGAALAIAIIAVSRLLISFLFTLYLRFTT